MCGIAGIIARGGFATAELVAMTDAVRYRGPDGRGFAVFGRGRDSDCELVHADVGTPQMARPWVGLGSRRLAILDLTTRGDQPMCDEVGNCYITHNGEIYNYIELRRELSNLGYRFKTHTDTEVILRAYRHWGPACLNRLNGMWSFAIWDVKDQRLFCARDRFGVKPFYYHYSPQRFLFGSEIKQIVNCDGFERSTNESVVFQFLENGLLDHSRETFFKGVSQLPAGHFLTMELGDPLPAPVIEQYWTIGVHSADESISEEAASEEFVAKFERAVALRLRSDVRVGSCLSGGLDSSAIVCTARKLSPAGDFHSFSSCFEDRALDERAHIRTVVGAAALESHEVYPKSEEFWQEFERLLWHQDEPVASTNVYAQWCVMRAARQANIPVLLDGQGGDETLCGYMKFYIFHLSNLLRRADWRFIPEVIAWSTSGTRSHFSWEDATKYIPHSFGRVSPVAKVTHPEFRHQFARSGVAFRVGQTVQARQLADINTFSLPALLHYEDRNSMAHSIETRLPFLDYELVQFLVNCRSSLKLRKGWSKWLLRRALSGTIPESIRLRKNKLGFDSPQTQWLRKALKKGMAESAFDGNLRMNKFLSRKNLLNEARKVADNKRGAIPASVLFRALTLEKWARVHDVSS